MGQQHVFEHKIIENSFKVQIIFILVFFSIEWDFIRESEGNNNVIYHEIALVHLFLYTDKMTGYECINIESNNIIQIEMISFGKHIVLPHYHKIFIKVVLVYI